MNAWSLYFIVKLLFSVYSIGSIERDCIKMDPVQSNSARVKPLWKSHIKHWIGFELIVYAFFPQKNYTAFKCQFDIKNDKTEGKKNGLRRADVRLVCTVPWHKLTQERRLFKETFKLFSIVKHDSVRCSISVWRYTNQRLSAFTTHFCVDYFFHSCSTEAWWKVFTQYVVRYILRLLAYLLIVLIFSRRTWYHNIQ